MAGRKILQGCADDAGEIIATVLVEFVIFHRDHSVHEIAWQLIVRNRLPVFDIDLAKNPVIAINNDAGRFHLFELREIERGGFFPKDSEEMEKIKAQTDQEEERSPNRHIEDRFGKPRATKVPNRGTREIRNWHAMEPVKSLNS